MVKAHTMTGHLPWRLAPCTGPEVRADTRRRVSVSSTLFCALFVSLFTLTTSPSSAQQTLLTQEHAVALGLKRANFEQQRKIQLRTGEGAARLASAWDNPALDYQREQPGDGLPTLDILEMTQQLNLSGQRGLRREAALLRSESKLKQLTWVRTRYVLEIKARFHDVLYRQTLNETMARWCQHLREIHTIIEARARAGDVASLELKRIESTLALVESRREAALIDLDKAWSQLEALIGSPDTGKARDSGETGARPRAQGELLPDDDDAARLSPERRADIEALELEQRALQLEQQAAERGWIPTLQLGVGYLRQRGVESGDNADGLKMSLGLELPIFDRGQGDARLAQSASQDIGLTRDRLALRLDQRSKSAPRELRRRVRLARSFQEHLTQAEETAKLAKTAYQGDALSLGELLTVYEHLHAMHKRAATLKWQARQAYFAAKRLHGVHGVPGVAP